MTSETPQGNATFDEKLGEMRVRLKDLGAYVKRTKEQKSKFGTDGIEDLGEVIANMTLAYRHIEDASMRIGKTIQARNGGVSVYDNTAVGTPEGEHKKISEGEFIPK